MRGMNTPSRSSKSGFTLVEVLTAVAIITILASISYATLSAAKQKSRDTQRVSDLQNLQVALRMYREVHGVNPDITDGELIGDGSGTFDDDLSGYLSGTMQDPLHSTNGFGYYYKTDYSCNGTTHDVLVALTMEQENAGNFDTCDATTPDEVVGGISPTSNSYVIIVK